ncbi:maestro heat-like repeat-containing protein family member 7 [Porphyrio hochstetteri]
MTALLYLLDFFQLQESRAAAKDEVRQLRCQPKATSLLHKPSTRDLMTALVPYLRRAERTGIVLTTIEAMRDSSIFEKEGAREVVDVIMIDPDFWLEDVPKIMGCISKHLESITTESARQSVLLLLLLMTESSPTDMLISLLKFPPQGDSSGLALWEAMLSVPRTLEKIFKELLSRVQDGSLHSLVNSAAEECHELREALRMPNEFQWPELSAEFYGETSFMHASLLKLSLLLRGLVVLSERADMARKMQVLLPNILEVLWLGRTADIKTKVLEVFRNVTGHLKREEASPIWLQLAKELLPVFDDECSQVRELSISLFRDAAETVLEKDRKSMKKSLQRSLLPLFFHMHDKADSVTKAAGEALLAVAQLLKWKELQDLVQTQQTWRIGECLLRKDGSRAEEYCHQSIPYLKDAQATLQEAAVRFIGLAARLLSQEKLPEVCSDHPHPEPPKGAARIQM